MSNFFISFLLVTLICFHNEKFHHGDNLHDLVVM